MPKKQSVTDRRTDGRTDGRTDRHGDLYRSRCPRQKSRQIIKKTKKYTNKQSNKQTQKQKQESKDISNTLFKPPLQPSPTIFSLTPFRSPAYSIGMGWPGGNDKTVGPGPAAYKPDSRYNQHGKAGGPYAFATWKPKDPLERRGPGPTDYDTIKKV